MVRTAPGRVDAVAATITQRGGTVDDELAALDMVVADPTAAGRAALGTDPDVVSVQADTATHETGDFQSVLGETDQWLGATLGTPTPMSTVDTAIGATQLWAKGDTGAGVDVALIDSGIAPVAGLTGTHVVQGPDLSFDSQYPEGAHVDGYGHGTHLAGIIAGNDGSGFVGVAPGARLVNVKVGAHDGSVDVSQVLAAIDWVVEHRHDDGLNIRVINLSYGTDGTQSYLTDPLTYAAEVAWRAGITVVVAAGNDGSAGNALNDPATDPYVLSVGADDLGPLRNLATLAGVDGVAPFSSTSTTRSPDLLAPGVSIVSQRDPGSWIDQSYPSAQYQTNYFRGSGTSQSAAVVSGAVALLLQANPNLTPDQVKDLLVRSATKLLLAPTSAQGAGRINVATAAALAPRTAAQSFAKATGTGSLEAARGSVHVASGGVDLTGEQDIMSVAWSGARQAPLSAAGTAWSGGTWHGTRWTGNGWVGGAWATAAWPGTAWDGAAWTGPSWTGHSWTGHSWTGHSWTGHSWTGAVWG